MNITKTASRVTVSLLCAALVLTGLPLNAGSLTEELRHEAFLRGGTAISVALNAPSDNVPAVSTAIEETMPLVPPAPTPQVGSTSSGMSKKMWAILIGGFVAGGAVVYWVATGPGASIRNCSTCSK